MTNKSIFYTEKTWTKKDIVQDVYINAVNGLVMASRLYGRGKLGLDKVLEIADRAIIKIQQGTIKIRNIEKFYEIVPGGMNIQLSQDQDELFLQALELKAIGEEFVTYLIAKYFLKDENYKAYLKRIISNPSILESWD